MIAAFAFMGRYGRVLLVVGLVAGFLLPGIAAAMKPALPTMVAFLVFVSALRIGARDALGGLRDARDSLRLVVLLQVAVPLFAIGVFWGLGWLGSLFAAAAILALCGSSISGGPAFTVMLGHRPEQALRLLILGTMLLPLTILPVFWLTPGLGDAGQVVLSALRLTAVLAVAIGLAFAVRRALFPEPTAQVTQALDGLAALTLAVIVVGLMAAVGPALRTDPVTLLPWVALVFAVNIGQQVAARLAGASVAGSVVAGNRNIALFLVALPADIIEPLLLFVGCYQIPMYLTPVLMKRFYART